MTDKSHRLWQQRLLAILCGIATVAILIATLWPFDFFPQNRVSWLTGVKGIRFAKAGVVVSKSFLKASETDFSSSCSLEMLLRPAAVESLRTILSIYSPDNPRRLLIRQWKDGLLVSRDVVDAQHKMKSAQFNADHIFQSGKLLLVTMTSGPDGTVVYTNGTVRQVFPRFTISQNDFAGQIVMGTAPRHYEPWLGEVRGLAIYSKELVPVELVRDYGDWTEGRASGRADSQEVIAHYAFTEGAGRDIHNAVASGPDLEIPKMFEVPHKPLLQSPESEFRANWDYVHDLLVNIAGFVPLGFIYCTYLGCARSRRQSIVYAILAGGVLSLVIEVLQVFIPERGSGMTDIITNTLGAAIGTALARPNPTWAIFDRIKSLTASERSF